MLQLKTSFFYLVLTQLQKFKLFNLFFIFLFQCYKNICFFYHFTIKEHKSKNSPYLKIKKKVENIVYQIVPSKHIVLSDCRTSMNPNPNS